MYFYDFKKINEAFDSENHSFVFDVTLKELDSV